MLMGDMAYEGSCWVNVNLVLCVQAESKQTLIEACWRKQCGDNQAPVVNLPTDTSRTLYLGSDFDQ